jgi:hypothetical protein
MKLTVKWYLIYSNIFALKYVFTVESKGGEAAMPL